MKPEMKNEDNIETSAGAASLSLSRNESVSIISTGEKSAAYWLIEAYRGGGEMKVINIVWPKYGVSARRISVAPAEL